MIGIAIGAAFGYSLGFVNGSVTSLSWAVHTGAYFLKTQGANITIDEQLIVEGLSRYKNNIGGCWDIGNSSKIK